MINDDKWDKCELPHSELEGSLKMTYNLLGSWHCQSNLLLWWGIRTTLVLA